MDLGEISLDKIRLWSRKALKVFLSVRKLSIDASFEEFAARLVTVVFNACGLDLDRPKQLFVFGVSNSALTTFLFCFRKQTVIFS